MARGVDTLHQGSSSKSSASEGQDKAPGPKNQADGLVSIQLLV